MRCHVSFTWLNDLCMRVLTESITIVGGTSGIGESTARAFIRNTNTSRAYLVGRDQARAIQIIEELRQVKPDSQISFVKADVSLLWEVDNVCRAIQQKEDRLNILFLSPGVGTMKGRDGKCPILKFRLQSNRQVRNTDLSPRVYKDRRRPRPEAEPPLLFPDAICGQSPSAASEEG